ncbi:MAG: transposase family protein [Methylobacter sp.]|nr:transposase family protein [Methylobacter sp.]
MSCSFIEHFLPLKDPRIERKKPHILIDILVPTVCAIIRSVMGWEEIVEFGRSKLDWLVRFFPLKNRVPSHDDCIAYVISRLSPEGFWLVL